jgi:hypothetical protein
MALSICSLLRESCNVESHIRRLGFNAKESLYLKRDLRLNPAARHCWLAPLAASTGRLAGSTDWNHVLAGWLPPLGSTTGWLASLAGWHHWLAGITGWLAGWNL